jgi:thymidylate synthase ThyX
MSLCIVNAKELPFAVPRLSTVSNASLTVLVSDITTEFKEFTQGMSTLAVANLDVLMVRPFNAYLKDLRILLFFSVMAEICKAADMCTITLNETDTERIFELGCATFAIKAPLYTLKQLAVTKFAVVAKQ